MKGVVFTEFIEMVETLFSPEIADAVIHDARPPSGGAYTAVGTYSPDEMRSLVSALSDRVSMSVSELYRTFGRHLLHRLAELYPVFFASAGSAHGLLRRLDDTIHVEVHKLYPDAELPRFFVEEDTGDRLVMRYESPRAMADLAVGLIRGCGEHYEEPLEVTTEKLVEDGTVVRFTIESRA